MGFLKRYIRVYLILFLGLIINVNLHADKLMLHDFEKELPWNNLDNRSGSFQKAPTSCNVGIKKYKDRKTHQLQFSRHYLKIEYSKKAKGGPRETGGWCGWYTIIKKDDDKYKDLTDYNFIRFYYKPETGKEDFTIGLADKRWDKLQDSLHLQSPLKDFITKKFKSGWMEVIVPFYEFDGLDFELMSSFAVIFKPGNGIILVDNILFGYDIEYD